MDDLSYEQLWLAFANDPRLRSPDRPRRGRRDRAAVIVRVNDGSLFRRLDRIRGAIDGFAGIRTVPDHYLHLPLIDLGPIAARDPRPDELSRRDLTRLARELGGMAGAIPAHRGEIRRVNVDARGVFAEIHPPGAVIDLQTEVARRLATSLPSSFGALSGPISSQNGRAPYYPGLLVGATVADADGRGLYDALTWFRDRPIGHLEIDAIEVVIARRDHLFPRLARVGRIPLDTRS
jgi:hypothetical protein